MKYNIMSTPAIVINEEVIIKGRVPSKDEIKELLFRGASTKDSSSSEGCCSGTN